MSDTARNEDRLERIGAEIRSEAERLDPTVEAAALERIGRQLATVTAPAAAQGTGGVVLDCAEIQQLLPAYLSGALRPERSLLVQEHTRSCVACRRALKTLQKGTPAPVVAQAPRLSSAQWKWGLAAAAAVAVLAVQFFIVRHHLPTGDNALRVIDGVLLTVSGEQAQSLEPGADVAYGKELVAPRGGTATVELADGSRVEMKERSRMKVIADAHGTTIALDAGNVIVEAAKQRKGKLYVQTGDCLVWVTGTVFSVNHGVKGSRVSVFEGEVRVDQTGRPERVLHPGSQTTTTASLGTRPLAEEIAWSARADEYVALLHELTTLNAELREVPRPDLRYRSVLLDRLPAATVLYVALPNLADTVQTSLAKIRERVGESEVLRQWWQGKNLEEMAGVAEKLSGLGADLGDELVIAGWLADGHFAGPVALAETRDPAHLRAQLADELGQLAQSMDGAQARIVDDPFAPGLPEDDALLLWIDGDVVVAAPGAQALATAAAAVLGQGPTLAGTFHDAVAARYEHGVDTLLGVDLQALVAAGKGPEDLARLEKLGLDGVQDLVVEQRVDGDQTRRQAVLSFRDTRRGVAAWLAAPGPMGSLSFVSADASAATAFVVREPRLLFADVLAALTAEERQQALDHLAELEREHGWSLDDLFAPLGGEAAFAIDGPVAPVLSWKLVVEVYDPARLQSGLERVVADLGQRMTEAGKGSLQLTHEERGGLTVYRLLVDRVAGENGSVGPREVDWVYRDGYLVATPSLALLDRALASRDSGANLLASGKLRALLPADSEIGFSALWYQDFSTVTGPLSALLGGRIDRLPEEQRQAVQELGESMGPAAAWAYGEDDQIRLSATSKHNPLALFSLFALHGVDGAAKAGTMAAHGG